MFFRGGRFFDSANRLNSSCSLSLQFGNDSDGDRCRQGINVHHFSISENNHGEAVARPPCKPGAKTWHGTSMSNHGNTGGSWRVCRPVVEKPSESVRCPAPVIQCYGCPHLLFGCARKNAVREQRCLPLRQIQHC